MPTTKKPKKNTLIGKPIFILLADNGGGVDVWPHHSKEGAEKHALELTTDELMGSEGEDAVLMANQVMDARAGREDAETVIQSFNEYVNEHLDGEGEIHIAEDVIL